MKYRSSAYMDQKTSSSFSYLSLSFLCRASIPPAAPAAAADSRQQTGQARVAGCAASASIHISMYVCARIGYIRPTTLYPPPPSGRVMQIAISMSTWGETTQSPHLFKGRSRRRRDYLSRRYIRITSGEKKTKPVERESR